MLLSPDRPLADPPAASFRRPTREPWLRHLCFATPVVLVTVAAMVLAVRALPLTGPARWIYAAAVALNVGLLMLSSWSTVLGAAVAVWRRVGGRVAGPVLGVPTGVARTAVLLPVYEEDAARVFAAAGVMAQSLAGQRLGAADLFVLSDTRSDTGAAAEETAHRRLLARLPVDGPAVYYRRRTQNGGRKAGNIAEFIGRWGAEYDFMVVLDADSLMTGATIAQLVGAMEANPNAGLIQSMCYPIGRSTLFARIQQFSARLGGPLLAQGVAWWQGPRGSYWGHNAIVRIAAFAGHCGLPHLPGRAPLGGEILCHDTVEAALMLRAGWDVWLLPHGAAADGPQGGSWEETPTNMLDHLDRDRRWCQGNLQHGRVLLAEGLKPASLVHIGQGLAHYLSAPLFFVTLALGFALPAVPAGGGHGAGRALWAIVLACMLVPRLLTVGSVMVNRDAARGFGGRLALLASVLLDQIWSLLAGPVSLVFYVVFVATTLSGRVVRWDAQPRDDRGLGWTEAARRLGPPLLVAALPLVALAPSDLLLAATLLPGLLLGVPVAVLSSTRRAGEAAARLGLFRTPEETLPPALLPALAAAEAALRMAGPEREAPALPPGAGLSVRTQTLRQPRLARALSVQAFP